MKNIYPLLGFALLLSGVLTASHVLLRASAAYTVMEFPWFMRVGSALFLYALVFIVYAVLLKYFDISVLYPVYTAFSIIGVFFAGVFFFGEEFSLYKAGGVLFLILGVKLITM